MSLRILVTGSRDWTDRTVVQEALLRALSMSTIGAPVLVHGGAVGADAIAAQMWGWLGRSVPGGLDVECYLAKHFPTPLDRNAHMVSLGADVCLAFASAWASGTGHCARLARKAGIPTTDFGFSTRIEDRP